MEWPNNRISIVRARVWLWIVGIFLEISCFCFSISLITSFIHACLIPKTCSGLTVCLSVCITNASCRSVFCSFYILFFMLVLPFFCEHGMMSWVFRPAYGTITGVLILLLCILLVVYVFFYVRVCVCLLIDILLSYSRSSDLTFYMLITIWYRFTHFPNISYSFFLYIYGSLGQPSYND